MAWYYGEFSCGHEGRVNITGPIKNRQSIADKKFEGLCEKCYREKKENERKKSNEEAAEKAKKLGLPALQGTEKQIAWAESIRQDLFSAFEIKGSYKHINRNLFNEFMSAVHKETRANWFIDHRGNYCFSKRFEDFMEEYIEEVTPRLIIEKEKEDVLAIDAKTEATIRPEHTITNAVSEIKVSEDKIVAIFEKNAVFIETVKSLQYKWNGSVWERNLNELTGLATDRAAELGNKLLNAGIPIMIMDENIRKVAISGKYEPECNRWILKVKDDENKLKIKWWEKNDRLYQVARRLPGSKWNKGVIVNIAHYPEIEEFANLYEFKFTQEAVEAIEYEKKSITMIDVVSPNQKDEQSYKDGLKEILNSGSDIIDDLKD